MNILVTGANGQLGNEMRIVSKGSKDKYIFTDVTEQDGVETTILDITDLKAIKKMVKDYNVKAIVNCAAYTNVDKAESDKDFCELLNAKAPENLAVAMKEVNGLLVHISTDYVFGGDAYNTPCKEDQEGTPTGVYGLTKLHGEQNTVRDQLEASDRLAIWEYASDQSVEPEDGLIGVAIVVPDADSTLVSEELDHALLLKDIPSGGTLSYCVGSCWSKGDIKSSSEWFNIVREL